MKRLNLPIIPSPRFKARKRAFNRLEDFLIAPDNEFDILIKHPLTNWKKDKMDRQLTKKTKFQAVKLW